jgi:hypothetical protein
MRRFAYIFRFSLRGPTVAAFPLFCFLCLLCLTFPAAALTPALLVHPDLSEEPIHIIGFGEAGLVFFDADRVQRTAPLSAFVQVRAIGGRATQATQDASMVELTDGQVLTGQWKGANESGSALRWEHAALGTVDLPLTTISRVRLADRPAPAPDPEVGDVVVLSNGDRMTGFVESAGQGVITITPTGADAAIDLPADRLAGLSLANPPDDGSAAPYRLVLDDGSRVAATDLTWLEQTLSFTPALGAADRALTLPVERLVRIDAAGSGRVLRPLASAAMELTDGGRVFGVPYPPRAHGETISLHAPATVRFTLPPGARRLAATVRLDLPATLSDDRRRLADCTLTIDHGQDEPTVIELSADQPESRINVPLIDGTLELTAGEGAFGPILDRIALTDALMLVETNP